MQYDISGTTFEPEVPYSVDRLRFDVFDLTLSSLPSTYCSLYSYAMDWAST